MKRALTNPPTAKLTPQRSRVTARRKMASLRIGTHRRLFRIAMNARLVAIIDEKNRHRQNIVNGMTKNQQEPTGGAN